MLVKRACRGSECITLLQFILRGLQEPSLIILQLPSLNLCNLGLPQCQQNRGLNHGENYPNSAGILRGHMMMHFFGIEPIHKLSALFSVSRYIMNRIGFKNFLCGQLFPS